MCLGVVCWCIQYLVSTTLPTYTCYFITDKYPDSKRKENEKIRQKILQDEWFQSVLVQIQAAKPVCKTNSNCVREGSPGLYSEKALQI